MIKNNWQKKTHAKRTEMEMMQQATSAQRAHNTTEYRFLFEKMQKLPTLKISAFFFLCSLLLRRLYVFDFIMVVVSVSYDRCAIAVDVPANRYAITDRNQMLCG